MVINQFGDFDKLHQNYQPDSVHQSFDHLIGFTSKAWSLLRIIQTINQIITQKKGCLNEEAAFLKIQNSLLVLNNQFQS